MGLGGQRHVTSSVTYLYGYATELVLHCSRFSTMGAPEVC